MAKDSLTTRANRLVKSNKTVGISILGFAVEGINHARTHGDSTPLAIVCGGLDPADSNRFRRILGHVFATDQVTFKRDASQASGFSIKPKGRKWGEVEVSHNAMGIIERLVADGVSFRSKRVADELFGEKVEKEFDPAALAKRVLKNVTDHGMTPAEFMHILSEAAKAKAKGA